MNLPYLIFSDLNGNIQSHPALRAAASSLDGFILAEKDEMIPLAPGSSLFYLPYHSPVGFDPASKKFVVLDSFEGKNVFAVAAFPIPAYLRLHSPAAIKKKKILLPLWPYTCCGFSKGKFYMAAKRVDSRIRQSPRFYDRKVVNKAVRLFSREYPQNRLYEYLANCALNYNCLAAKNLFLKRWEAPLPTAQTCNARCVGCLSEQSSGCVASHGRINFKPTVDEISQVMQNHLKAAREAIASFGQGCEGEPLTCTDVIAKSIFRVRNKVQRGTININTNASVPKKIELLCQAGIDSFRVSLNSPREKFYNLYFRPKGYKFKDVLESIAIAKKYNKFVSINLFVFPGFSDSREQIEDLENFIKNNGIDMIQWRNLNIDSKHYIKLLGKNKFTPQGVNFLIQNIKKKFPKLKHGYFNIQKERFYKGLDYGAF